MTDKTNLEKQIEQLEQEQKNKEEEIKNLDLKEEKTQEEEEKLEALKKEKERILEQIKTLREEKRKLEEEAKRVEETNWDKFRKEQEEKALNKFFSDFNYESEEDKRKLIEEYRRISTGEIDAEKIYQTLKKAHLLINPDKYLEIEKKIEEGKARAEDIKTTSVGQSKSDFVEEDVELTEDDYRAIRWAGISEDKYKEYKKKGLI